MRDADDGGESFDSFVHGRSPALLRTAWLLTGNEAAAHDLVQTALLKTWARWRQVVAKDAPEAYVRRVMVTTSVSWGRRRWTGERATASLDDVADGVDASAHVDTRAAVASALRQLPPGQRAVVVLRFFDDLSEKDTAELLNCSVGTVKSQASRALARLRADPALAGLWEGKVNQ